MSPTTMCFLQNAAQLRKKQEESIEPADKPSSALQDPCRVLCFTCRCFRFDFKLTCDVNASDGRPEDSSMATCVPSTATEPWVEREHDYLEKKKENKADDMHLRESNKTEAFASG
ncbi:hypothetical protein EMWEY_00041290 [Eimeria maxima]|uniref:Uncharacterized protein n=1 Tax=Eimeria maxima TaxID=5804 RepID=U6MB72_EIMMA|nr:hypothetical protein EMWEY_00041290 [Eimeria maxima]CDJ61462.1 hypothetical protein EMWEY_00041290 [Eimeria maxima]